MDDGVLVLESALFFLQMLKQETYIVLQFAYCIHTVRRVEGNRWPVCHLLYSLEVVNQKIVL